MSVVIVGGGLMGLGAAFHLRWADPSLAVAVLLPLWCDLRFDWPVPAGS